MTNSIPAFDHNLVLPQNMGNPTAREQLSPYPCTTVDLCQRFGISNERRRLLVGFLDFRAELRRHGLVNGFQWLDGSFLEDIERLDNRPPKDIDVVTVYWGYDFAFQVGLMHNVPEFASSKRAKDKYYVDHYPFDAGHTVDHTLDTCRYWVLLFSRSRLGVPKGMLKIDLNTPAEDELARQELEGQAP